MKIYSIIIVLTSVLLLNGCNNNSNSYIKNSDNENTTQPMSAKEYVENNTYINVDIIAISNALSNSLSRDNSISEEDMAKTKAAIYRFYKNVTMDNGIYSCNLTSGEEINVSSEVFSVLLDNLNEMNKSAQEIRDKGGKIEMSVPDENYLNSLLQ